MRRAMVYAHRQLSPGILFALAAMIGLMQPVFALSWNQLREVAVSAMNKGDAQAAAEAWRASIGQCPDPSSKDPRYVISVRGLAKCLQQQGKAPEAEELYSALIGDPSKVDPSNGDMLAATMEYAALLHAEGKTDAAARLDKSVEPVIAKARKVSSSAPTPLSFGAGEAPTQHEHLKWESADGSCVHNPSTAPISLPQPKAKEEDRDEKLPGEDRDKNITHTDRWRVLAQRGHQLYRQQKYQAAEKALREAYAETRIFHRRDQEHQNVMLDLAMVFASEGKANETHIMFRNAFLWASKYTGEVSDETVRVWERYRDAMRVLGQSSEATIAENRYEESLFKLNNAVSSGQIGAYGPLTHIAEPKSLFGPKPAGRAPYPGSGSLHQDPQYGGRFMPRFGGDFGGFGGFGGGPGGTFGGYGPSPGFGPTGGGLGPEGGSFGPGGGGFAPPGGSFGPQGVDPPDGGPGWE